MMATSSRKRFSECEQDINRTSKRLKVDKGDGHYMEDAIILGVIFLDKQRIHRRKEKMTAKLVVEAKEKTKILEAFTPILCEICQGVVTEEALLTAKPFNLTYSWREVINGISRKTTTVPDHHAISWRSDKKTVQKYLGESSDD